MRQRFARITHTDGRTEIIMIHYKLEDYPSNYTCINCGKSITPILYKHDPESDHFFHIKCDLPIMPHEEIA